MTDENKQEAKDVLDISALLRKELEEMSKTVAPPSGFVIGTKGKRFTLPDGSASDGPLTCVIVDWISFNKYYSGAYNANALTAPDCWALNKNVQELGPSKSSPKPQNETCEGCPRNEWGSAIGGGKGKACKNTRRLLVISVAELAANGPDAQAYTIDVSPTGLKHFDKYITSLNNRDAHPASMITDITFEPNESFPSLRFKAVEASTYIEAAWHCKTANQSLLTIEPTPSEK
tara:strand:+ start:16007 stop:16702 length:696 start_codon:yes stop_codon:yes gene_type:complete